MAATLVNLYQDKWVLTSSARLRGGGTIDVEPVLLIDISDPATLADVLRKLAAAEVPVIDQDWNDRRPRIPMRVEALGLKSWRTFVKNARAFLLKSGSNGLSLEEWPRVGGYFDANPTWRHDFPSGAYRQVADYLVELATEGQPEPSPKPKSRARPGQGTKPKA